MELGVVWDGRVLLDVLGAPDVDVAAVDVDVVAAPEALGPVEMELLEPLLAPGTEERPSRSRSRSRSAPGGPW